MPKVTEKDMALALKQSLTKLWDYGWRASDYATRKRTIELEPVKEMLTYALPHSPDDPVLNAMMANIHMEEGHYEEALLCLEKSRSITEEREDKLATIFYETSQYEDAIPYLNIVGGETPDNYFGLKLAYSYLQTGQKEEALQTFKTLLADYDIRDLSSDHDLHSKSELETLTKAAVDEALQSLPAPGQGA